MELATTNTGYAIRDLNPGAAQIDGIRGCCQSPVKVVMAGHLRLPIGCIKSDAQADLFLVEGDPLKDIGLLAVNGRHLRLIMRAGEIIQNDLK